MDVREKLVELQSIITCPNAICNFCEHFKNKDACEKHKKEVIADNMIAHGVTVQEWISVDERIPQNFVSVLGYMTDAGEFPPVRECYTVGIAFFFPALGDVHPVSHWCEMPQPPKGE